MKFRKYSLLLLIPICMGLFMSLTSNKVEVPEVQEFSSLPTAAQAPLVVSLPQVAAELEDFAEKTARGEVVPLTEDMLIAAEIRYEKMKRLIVDDPEEALRHALPPRVIDALPEELQAYTERHVAGVGFYGVAAVRIPLHTGLHSHSHEEHGHGHHHGHRLAHEHDHAHEHPGGHGHDVPHVHEYRYTAVFEEEAANPVVYRAHVYGERLLEKKSEENASLYGVAIGEDVALADTAVYVGRQSDGTWLVAAGGGMQTFENESLAEMEAEAARLRIAAMDSDLEVDADALDLPEGVDPPWDVPYEENTGAYSHTKGVKTLLFIYAKGSGAGDPDVTRKTDAELRDELEDTSRWYYDVSYRQTWFGKKTWEGSPGPGGEDYVPMIHVVPVTVTLPEEASYYNSGKFYTTRTHLRNAVRALGGEYAEGERLDPDNFDRITFLMKGGGFGNGLAFVRSDFFWAGGNLSGGVAVHEIGHNWGLDHAGHWSPTQAGTGVTRHPDNTHGEYGGAGDIMGGSGGGPFNVLFKEKLGFIEKNTNASVAEVVEVRPDDGQNIYRLFDHTNVDARNSTSAVRGLYIPIVPNGFVKKELMLGFRHQGESLPFSENSTTFYKTWGLNAVEVLSEGASSVTEQNYGSHYLDTSPYSYYSDGAAPGGQGDDKDGAIPLGRTYSEPVNLNGNQIYGGFHITPVGRGQATDDAGTPGDVSDDTTHEWIDVKVVYAIEVSNNETPAISTLTASTLTPAVGENVTLEVSATDADGDDLYYWWKFHQMGASQDNQSRQTMSWDEPGEYYVTVHVSDGKGGVAVDGVKITVGTPPVSYEIRGRVLRGGQPVAGAKLWIDSPRPASEGDMWHDAFSESDGTYRFTNLPPGSYTVKMAHPVFQESVSPSSHAAIISSASHFGLDFDFQVSPTLSYTVSGKILDNLDQPLGGAMVSSADQQTLSAPDGTYELTNIPLGTHTVVAIHPKYSFNDLTVNVNGNLTNRNLTCIQSPLRIRVPDIGDDGYEDQQGIIFLEGYPNAVPFTTDRGSEVEGKIDLPSGVPVNVRVNIPGFTATPDSFANPYTLLLWATERFRLEGSASQQVIVDGYVHLANGMPLAGITVGNGTASATTDASGYYQLSVDGSTGSTVVAPAGGFTFSPSSRTVSLSSNWVTVDPFVFAGGDDAPSVSVPASAVAFNHTQIHLNVLGADDHGEAGLTYSWEKISGAGAIEFLTNYTNEANSTVATVKAAGTYVFKVTIRDGLGNEVESTTSSVTMVPVLNAMIVSPGYGHLGLNTTKQFTVQGYDQFGDPVSVAANWSVSSGGTISHTGELTATTLGTDYVVTATSGSVQGTAIFNVIAAAPEVSVTNTSRMGFNPGTYTLAADAFDPDGTITKVEFYLNGSKVGEDTTAPYSYDLIDHPFGQYDYRAMATDNEGNTTETVEYRFWISAPISGITKINFERIVYATPEGFLPDKGDGFGVRSNGLHYGWHRTNLPDKDSDPEKGMWTWVGSYPSEELSHMKRWSGSTYTWKIRVPNGRYTVDVRVGNPEVGFSQAYRRYVNDIQLDGNAGAVGNEFITLSTVVDVTDNLISVRDVKLSDEGVGTSYIVITSDIPVVSVTAGEDGDEHTPQAIDFTVTRQASLGESFTLNFSLGGTAVAADYTVSGATTYNSVTGTGTVDFAAGEVNNVITLTPVQDTEVEGTETIRFNIEDGTGYASSTSIAVVDLFDAQTNYPPTANPVWPVNGQSVSLDVNGSHWVEVSGEDDGFGGSSLSFSWSQVSGPGTATFADEMAAATSVTVDAAGEYTLRATVSDGTLSDTVDVTLNVGNAVTTNGQLVHWDLNEGSGTSVTDQSVNGHDGTSGAGWTADGGGVSGRAGDTAAVFSNNISHQISGTDVAALGSLGGFTVSLWVKPDASGTDRGLFSSRPLSEWNGVNDEWPGISMRYDAAGWFTDLVQEGGQPPNVIQSIITFPLGGGSIQLYAETSANVQVANQWQHIVLTWTRGDRPRYYINGVEDAGTVYGTREGTDNNTTLQNNVVDQDLVDASAFVLGRGAKDTSGSWDGGMDEFRFYNRALTAAEVSSLYNGSPVNTVPVVSATSATTVDVNTALPLDGNVSDAESTPTSTWRKLSGPGTASFADDSAEDTSVTFDTAGTYEIALVANDGDMADGAVLTITVGGGMVDNNGNDVPDSWEATHEDPGQPGTVQLADGNNYAIRNVYFWGVDSTSGDPLSATDPRPSGASGFQFTFYGVSGVSYRVRCTTDLNGAPVWTTLTGYDNILGADAIITVTDPSPGPRCTYRVEVLVP